MDSVPMHKWGSWSALEMVNMFLWSFSTFLGGVSVKWNGILFNFSVTVIMQFLVTMPIVLMIVTTNTMEEQDEVSVRDNLIGSNHQHQESGMENKETEIPNNSDVVKRQCPSLKYLSCFYH
jgi:hypothetical protein